MKREDISRAVGNLAHRHILEAEAFFEGVQVKRCAGKAVLKKALLIAAAVCLLTLTAFAVSIFSTMQGDDVKLSAAYLGDGVVSVLIENKSDKELKLEPGVKLMLGKSRQEVEPVSGQAEFEGAAVPAGESTTVTVDLSGAYDMEQLEQAPSGDFYYLLLTNDGFALGQRWSCTVAFHRTEEQVPVPEDEVPAPWTNDPLLDAVLLPLRSYFENDTMDPFRRYTLGHEYMELCSRILSEVDGNIVPAVDAGLLVDQSGEKGSFAGSSTAEEQGQHIVQNYHIMDAYYKLVGATDEEKALVLSALVPQGGESGGNVDIPLIYILTYETGAIESSRDYAFIRGQLLTFGQLEKYKVYEDGKYVCYEVSGLFYSDLREYAEGLLSMRKDAYLSDDAWIQLKNIYDYYSDREVLGSLIYHR